MHLGVVIAKAPFASAKCNIRKANVISQLHQFYKKRKCQLANMNNAFSDIFDFLAFQPLCTPKNKTVKSKLFGNFWFELERPFFHPPPAKSAPATAALSYKVHRIHVLRAPTWWSATLGWVEKCLPPHLMVTCYSFFAPKLPPPEKCRPGTLPPTAPLSGSCMYCTFKELILK